VSKTSASERTLILALVNGVAERARIRTATSGRYELSFAARVRELEHALQTTRAPIAAVIVEEADVDRRSTCDVVRMIRRTSPGTPVVGYCDAGMRHSNDIRALVMAGVHELLFRNIDDAGVAMRAVIASAQRASVGEVVAVALKELVPSRLWQFVQRVATHPAECQRVSDVATALGYHRKTLVNHCAQALLPPPRELLAWCRLAVVGHLLGTTARSVESIALELDFPSDTALRNLVKRHVGLRATEVRRRGGLACILQAFEMELRRHRSASK
jgi:AraC-like DNA-binding protein